MAEAARQAAVAAFTDMLPPARTYLDDDDEEPAWIAAFVAKRTGAAKGMGWAVAQILAAAVGRCVNCSVDQLSQMVLPPIVEALENTIAEREEVLFEVNAVRRKAMQAGASMEGAKTQSRSKHFARIERELRTSLQELEQADARHADAVEQLVPLRDFIRQIIKRRLIVDPTALRYDTDSMLALGVNGADLSMEGSGTILHTAAEAGQLDAIEGWLQHLAMGDDSASDSSDDEHRPMGYGRPSTAEKEYEGKWVAVKEISSPHFGKRGMATAVSLRIGLIQVAFEDGTNSKLKVEYVHRDDQKTDAEIAAEKAYLANAIGPKKHERLGAIHIDARSPNGATPLYAAAYAGHLKVVELLLQEKADVHAARDDGCTPLHAASRNGHCDVVEALVEGGANMSQAGKRGVTPLCMAVAGLQRAQLRAAAKDVKGAAFIKHANELAAKGKPMGLDELNRGSVQIEAKNKGWADLEKYERTLNEFMWIGGEVQRVKREAQRYFRRFDTNYSGHLSKRELARMFDGRFEKLHTDTCKAQRKLAGYTDREGGIDWYNFWRWWWRRHKKQMWLPVEAKAEVSEALLLGYRTAFITESVEALWQDRRHKGMIAVLEGMVMKARKEAKAIEDRTLAESDLKQEREYAKKKGDWQRQMKAANEETRRKRTAVWRTDAGRELERLFEDLLSVDLISVKEVDKLKMKVQSGVAQIADLYAQWKKNWLVHCSRKGIASANCAPLVTIRTDRWDGASPIIVETDPEPEQLEIATSVQPWFDQDRCMFGAIPEAALKGRGSSLGGGGDGGASKPDHMDRRRVLTKGARFLVDELQAQSSDNRVLALWGLSVICGLNTPQGVKARQTAIKSGAVKPIISLLVHSGARQSEINLYGPAALAMLVYEDMTLSSMVLAQGGIAALVRLIELNKCTEVQCSALCCLANCTADGACLKECLRLEAPRLVRPLCLAQLVGSIANHVLECLHADSQEDPDGAKKRAELEMLNSPEVEAARASLGSPAGSPSDARAATLPVAAAISSWKQEKLQDELAVELPFLLQDFPHVTESEICRICERAGSINDAVMSQLTALNAETKDSTSNGSDAKAMPAADKSAKLLEPPQLESDLQATADNASAWDIHTLANFSQMDGLKAIKRGKKTMVAARPLHMLGGLFGGKATTSDLEETFAAFDVNVDGVLSASELNSALLSLGVNISATEAGAIVRIMDTDGDGEVDFHEFCRQFQKWTGGQLSDEEERTMRWHTKPTPVHWHTQLQELRNEYQIAQNSEISKFDLGDGVNSIAEAIIAERDTRLARAASKDRRKTRQAVKQAKKIYSRSDELAKACEQTRLTKLKSVEHARRGVTRLAKEQQKLDREIQRVVEKISSLVAAASRVGFVHRIDLTTKSGTPTVARRWLILERGQMVWRYGQAELLEEAEALSRSMSSPPAEFHSAPSRAATKAGRVNLTDIMRLEVDDGVAPWVFEAQEKLRSERDEYAISPLKSPLSTHRSFTKLSPLVSPTSLRTPKRRGSALAIEIGSPSSRGGKSPTSRRRRRVDTTSWESPLHGPGSNHDLLSVAELAHAAVTQEQPVTCATETDAAQYLEAREMREQMRKAAREAERRMPLFDPLVMRTAHYSNILRVGLGLPDSTGDNAYNIVVEGSEMQAWQKAVEAGISFTKRHSFFEEQVSKLTAQHREINSQLATWQRQLYKAELALEESDDGAQALLEACTRGDELAEWAVVDVVASGKKHQREVYLDHLGNLPNAFWGEVPLGQQRSASMVLMDGQTVA